MDSLHHSLKCSCTKHSAERESYRLLVVALHLVPDSDQVLKMEKQNPC